MVCNAKFLSPQVENLSLRMFQSRELRFWPTVATASHSAVIVFPIQRSVYCKPPLLSRRSIRDRNRHLVLRLFVAGAQGDYGAAAPSCASTAAGVTCGFRKGTASAVYFYAKNEQQQLDSYFIVCSVTLVSYNIGYSALCSTTSTYCCSHPSDTVPLTIFCCQIATLVAIFICFRFAPVV